MTDKQSYEDAVLQLLEELEELPQMCRDLVGPRCGEAYDRARNALQLAKTLTTDDGRPRCMTPVEYSDAPGQHTRCPRPAGHPGECDTLSNYDDNGREV